MDVNRRTLPERQIYHEQVWASARTSIHSSCHSSAPACIGRGCAPRIPTGPAAPRRLAAACPPAAAARSGRSAPNHSAPSAPAAALPGQAPCAMQRAPARGHHASRPLAKLRPGRLPLGMPRRTVRPAPVQAAPQTQRRGPQPPERQPHGRLAWANPARRAPTLPRPNRLRSAAPRSARPNPPPARLRQRRRPLAPRRVLRRRAAVCGCMGCTPSPRRWRTRTGA